MDKFEVTKFLDHDVIYLKNPQANKFCLFPQILPQKVTNNLFSTRFHQNIDFIFNHFHKFPLDKD